MLEEVHALAKAGVNPLPTKAGKKTPGLISHKEYQTQRVTAAQIDLWWGKDSLFEGVWVACGRISGLVVLDTDSAAAEEWWRRRIGAAMDATPSVKTRKGRHYWFRMPPEFERVQSWSYAEGDIRFDVLADGKGVMAPPSPHPDGGFYEWVRPLGEGGEGGEGNGHDAPALLLDGGSRAKNLLAHPRGKERHEEATESQLDAPRSLLSELMAYPPSEGGRNTWITKVAGHYAAFKLPRDAYEASVANAAALLADPLPDDELTKTMDSVWEGHQRRHAPPPGRPATPSTGWLAGTGITLLCEVAIKQGESVVHDIVEWADFDIELQGVYVDEGGDRTFLVRLSSDRNREINTQVEAKLFGSSIDTNRWLAGFGFSVMSPNGDVHGRHSPASRLLRYIDSQPAPTFKPVYCLGWHDPSSSFIHADGWITAKAHGDHDEWVPEPRLIKNGWAKFRYGFEHSDAVARAVLAEVLSYHDPVVTAVFGAWCMAVMNKGQLMHQVDSFPFMALEAPSESGKTTGYFAMQQQLCGNAGGHQQHTTASLRDALAVNRSGIVWCDDVTDTTVIEELLRHATVEGSKSKKGQDRTHTEEARLVGTVVLSGEGVQALHEQKALIDRCVVLAVPSPTARPSYNDPARLQWDDIVYLRERFPDLSVLSGWILQAALEAGARWVPKMKELRTGPGRHGTKTGILRVGARILAEVVGGETDIVATVDDWCLVSTAQYRNADNTLVLQMLPEYVITLVDLPSRPIGNQAVFADRRGDVWFSEHLLAAWWEDRYKHDARRRQTGSRASVKHQREALGITDSHKFSTAVRTPDRPDPRSRVFWKIPEDCWLVVSKIAGVATVAHTTRAESVVGDNLPGMDNL